MARSQDGRDDRSHRFPHPRGDGPLGDLQWLVDVWISPPAWGWPGLLASSLVWLIDFPTRVGMARVASILPLLLSRFPHPRGDGPLGDLQWLVDVRISPPAWGWPVFWLCVVLVLRDFPTRVGMARRRSARWSTTRRFPHPRGDGPQSMRRLYRTPTISPPAWGWPVG